MQIPSYKDKGKAILDPNEETNNENRAKRPRFATSANSGSNTEISEDQNANYPFKNNSIEAPLGIPFCLPSFCGPISTTQSKSSGLKSFKDQNVNFSNFNFVTGTGFGIDLNKDPISVPVAASGPHACINFDLNELPPVSPIENETWFGTDTGIGTGTELHIGTGRELRVGTGTELHIGTGRELRVGTGTELHIGTGTGTDLCVNTGELCDTSSMKKRMERIAKAKGLDGISDESAEVLNRGVDVFLKRIIAAVIGLNGSGTSGDPIRMEDLCVAMRLDPHLLGERSKDKLEKIMNRCFKQ